MSAFRVLWHDPSGVGRFDTIEADTREDAIWAVCRDTAGTGTEFVDCQKIKED